MNTDYKILAYILTTRLDEHLASIIHSNQTAYMSKHFIGLNIRSVQDFIDHVENNNLDHSVLFLDFKKAFDSISHHFLFQLLIRMGFPWEYVDWVKIMYTSVCSVIHFKDWMTPPITLQRGVHQGCPLSYHLFNQVGQVLIFLL